MPMFLNRPITVFAASLVLLWLSVQLGSYIGRKLRGSRKEDHEEDLGVVINATLTLLALIVGFSFSMAVSRYDQRKNYEEEEANAIGTEYVRVGLLPAADTEHIRQLLKHYLDLRMVFYVERDEQVVQQNAAETTKLQNEMWSAVEGPAKAQPTAPVALILSGMNDVLNTQGYTQAAWWNHIPAGAWTLMMALSVCCCLLIGYDSHRSHTRLSVVLPLILSIAFFLVADIDSPRRGLIRVKPQNLISLSDSLKNQ